MPWPPGAVAPCAAVTSARRSAAVPMRGSTRGAGDGLRGSVNTTLSGEGQYPWYDE